MPELPEVETIVRELRPMLVKQKIKTLKIIFPDSVTGDKKEVLRRISGRTIERLSRRGKYIVFELTGQVIFTVHLRMTGKLLLQAPEKQQKHVRWIMILGKGQNLFFVDMRRFGRLKLWPHHQALLPDLGIEPADERVIQARLQALKTGRAIKAVLLDQTIIAGVGNIYADEALFISRIHPLTACDRLTKKQKVTLSHELPLLLERACCHKGTTISDYRPPFDNQGGHQFHLLVYGRTGEPCPDCSRPIEKIRAAGRGTHFCPYCQRLPRFNSLRHNPRHRRE